jgi:predicted metal-binding protein
LLEETHLFANDFLKQAKYLFGVSSGPFLLKAIYEVQQFMMNYQEDDLLKEDESKQNNQQSQDNQQEKQDVEPIDEATKNKKPKSKQKQIMLKAMLQLQQEMYLRELIYQHIQRGYTANSMS